MSKTRAPATVRLVVRAEAQPTTNDLGPSLKGLADELELLADVLHLLRALSGADDGFASIDEASGKLCQEVEQLASLHGQGKSLAQALAQLQIGTRELEAAIRNLDDRLEMSRIKGRTEVVAMLPDATLRYLSFLVRELSPVGNRMDRLELLVTRLLTEQSGPRRSILPFVQVEGLLSKISGGSQANPELRKETIAAIEDAELKLRQISTIESFFSTNLYFDIRRHKQSLGPQLVDSAVLYAIARLNVAVGNRLADLLEQESRGESPSAEPKAVLGALTLKTAARFEETRRAARGGPSQQPPGSPRPAPIAAPPKKAAAPALKAPKPGSRATGLQVALLVVLLGLAAALAVAHFGFR